MTPKSDDLQRILMYLTDVESGSGVVTYHVVERGEAVTRTVRALYGVIPTDKIRGIVALIHRLTVAEERDPLQACSGTVSFATLAEELSVSLAEELVGSINAAMSCAQGIGIEEVTAKHRLNYNIIDTISHIDELYDGDVTAGSISIDWSASEHA